MLFLWGITSRWYRSLQINYIRQVVQILQKSLKILSFKNKNNHKSYNSSNDLVVEVKITHVSTQTRTSVEEKECSLSTSPSMPNFFKTLLRALESLLAFGVK